MDATNGSPPTTKGTPMSTDTPDVPAPNMNTDVPASQALHVKAIPYDVWCRNRHNANLSRKMLRDYVIRLLAEARLCRPGTLSRSVRA
jgi:hypothetical protein